MKHKIGRGNKSIAEYRKSLKEKPIEQILTPAAPEGRELKLELYEKCEDCAGSGAVYERDDNGDPYLDRCFKCNGEGYIKFIPAAPPRSAEEMIEEQCFTVSEKSPFLITKENALEAMHAYASQFRREVTDAEIEEHIYAVYSPKLDDDKDREFVYTVRACRGAMRSMAKWLRSKMKGE